MSDLLNYLQIYIDVDDSNAKAKMEEINKKIALKEKAIGVWKENAALYFHTAASILSGILNAQKQSAAIMVTESILSIGLTGAAIYRIEAQMAAALLGQQYGKAALLQALAATMGYNLIRTQALKYQAVANQRYSQQVKLFKESYRV